jgi:hypothetical protein
MHWASDVGLINFDMMQALTQAAAGAAQRETQP